MPGVPWHRRLAVRVAALAALASSLTLVLLALAGLRLQRSHAQEQVLAGAALLSDTITSSARVHMLEDRRQEAYATMRDIASLRGIEKVRLFNKEGQITFSTQPAETGTSVDKRAESCYACHAADRPLERLSVPSRSRVYRRPDGQRLLAMVTPIHNEPGCSAAACHAHAPGQQVLGVVDVVISLGESDAALEALQRRTLLGALLGVLVLSAALGLLAARVVVRPLTELVAGTQHVGQGDLGHRVALRRGDEIGRLAASFDGMTQALQAARAEIDALLLGLERQVDERTRALRDAQGQLLQAEKLASLGRMAASIAHEINNPLAGVLTFARLLLRNEEEREPRSPRRIQNLQLIERETRACIAIVRNMLEFARQRPLTLQPVDAAAVVEEAVSLVRHQATLKDIALETQGGPLPPLRADGGQIRQAVVNVLLNAVDATPRGGRVRVETGASAAGVEIAVSDTGPGIAAADLPHVFDPFFTTKEKGTGLGLSVVYGIVQSHGGRVDVESEPGRGTTFRIRLPLAPPADEAGAA